MDHDLELLIPILEMLEIEVCNILQNPGNIENLSFSTSSYPGNIGKWIFRISHILEILDRTIHTQSYPGNSGSYETAAMPATSKLVRMSWPWNKTGYQEIRSFQKFIQNRGMLLHN